MTETTTYSLEIKTNDNPDSEEIDDFLQQILLDLYEQGEIESIKLTRDEYVSTDDSIERFIDILDVVDSDAIRKAIDSVDKLEDS